MDTIYVVNRSAIITTDQARAATVAANLQVARDFGPVWAIQAQVLFEQPPLGGWVMYILDDSSQAGVGGFHADHRGRISGRVFTKSETDAGLHWTVGFTHEILEMLCDPSAGTDQRVYVDLPGRWMGYQCLPEVCDAVEGDQWAYQINGVWVTDFVMPWYFYRGASPDGKYDFRGHLTEPAPGLILGGYMGIYDPRTGRWSQVSDFVRSGRADRSAQRVISKLKPVVAAH